MIDVPYEEVLAKIKQESSLSDEEINQRIEKKLEELNGLISRDGAAHILANELGVKLTTEVREQKVKIEDIKLHASQLKVTGKVIRKYEVREFNKNGREGKVASLLLGDESGVTRLVFWNDQVEVFQELKEGDILQVQNPMVKESYQKDRLELQLNQHSTLTVNPEGVEVASRSQEREQKYIRDLKGGEQNVELVATIVQVYDPRFYDACPECRKKVTNGQCPTHGEVTPEINMSLNAFLDDGTGNIRTNFWKDQSLNLTGLSEDEFVQFRDGGDFEKIKTDLLGEIVKVVGSCRKNDMFDRIEFTANLIFKDVDPREEMKNLEKKANVEEVLTLDDLEQMGK